MPAAAIIWTDERVDELRVRWAAGDAASAIARDLGTTRNAVIGKAGRLKLSAKSAPKSVARQPVPITAPSSPPSADPLARPSRRKRIYRLVDLTNYTCRWPLWNSDAEPRIFCGLSASLENGRPYCAKHTRMAYTPARSR
jgi:GcrA cell cycle regulator